jgi:hypothetical protein
MRLVLLIVLFASNALAGPARIRVFVALADNQAQGIARVPAKIGNGEDPGNNLYWGCSDALPPILKASVEWKLVSTTEGPKPSVLRRAVFAHRSGEYELVADAYRGSAIMECTIDFFAALSSDLPAKELPLVAYIGHNGLMDFVLPDVATERRGPGRSTVVLCCKSQEYFANPLAAVNAQPILLTTQLMYPGGFLMRAAAEGWIAGETPEQIRQRAAAAYAKNQKIGLKAAAGVFAAGLK